MASGICGYVRDWHDALQAKGWWHSFDLPDGTHIDGVAAVEDLRKRLDRFPIPQDLRGHTVLDVGTWDGWFAFEMERRGAEVVAIDCWDNPRFREMHARLGSRVDYRQVDVYDLRPDTVGRFDIVLFLGVLYHLKHPLLALERVCSVTEGMAAVESFVLLEKYLPGLNVEQRAILEFFENDEFGGEIDNWTAPSLPCLLAMCRTAGFARVDHLATHDYGAAVGCYRAWDPPSDGSRGPELAGVYHSWNIGINFQTRSDEYVSAHFRSSYDSLSRDDVKPEVSGYGVRPLSVSRLDNGLWQANFKLPPGLEPGWHEVTIRIGGGLPGTARRIAVDLPVVSGALKITGLCDGNTWSPDVVQRSENAVVSVWAAGLAENADRNNVSVFLGELPLTVLSVDPHSGPEPRQINARMPGNAPSGAARLTVAVGGSAASAEFRID